MKQKSLLLTFFITFCLIFSLSGCEQQTKETAVFFYIIGSDLETDDGCATADLNELCAASTENLSIYIQAGGAKHWQNDLIIDTAPQRLTVKDGHLTPLETLSPVSMADRDTLTDFLRWADTVSSAKRRCVIFWNHGGGTALGFGCDQLHPSDTLTLTDFRDAFQEAAFHADFIGFDACLMATLENAALLSDCADYLIASEETEPSSGWFYTDWVNALNADPALPTEVLAEGILDDFISHSPTDEAATIALLSTKNASALSDALSAYLAERSGDLRSTYPLLSSARCRSVELGDASYDQIDLMSFLHAANADEALTELAQQTVLDFRSTLPDTCGLAFYFPFRFPWFYASLQGTDLFAGDYFDRFLSVYAYGEAQGNAPSIPSQLTGYEDDDFSADLTLEDWYDEALGEACFDASLSLVSFAPFSTSREGDTLRLPLSPDQLPLLAESELELWMEDSQCYLSLGRFPVQREEAALSASVPALWPSVGGQLIPFFTISEDAGERLGWAAATLNNGDDIQLILRWAGDSLTLEGYRYLPEEEELSFPTRSLLQLNPGDKLDIFCPAFSKGGYYNATQYYTDTIVVDDAFHAVLLPVSSASVYAGFHINDLYGRQAWSKPTAWGS